MKAKSSPSKTKLQNGSKSKAKSKAKDEDSEIHDNESRSQPVSDSDSDSDSDSVKLKMLEALNRKTMENFEFDQASSASSSSSSYGNGSEGENVENEEKLFDSEDDFENEDVSVDDEGSDDDDIIKFKDPSRGFYDDQTLVDDKELCKSERKSFMASALQKQLGTTRNKNPSSSKRKTIQDEEEAHLQSLDKSLSNLISNLNQSNSNSNSKRKMTLDELISSNSQLNSINIESLRKKNPQNHSRAIKNGINKKKLLKSLEDDKKALMSGTVRAKNSKTLTRRQMRNQLSSSLSLRTIDNNLSNSNLGKIQIEDKRELREKKRIKLDKKNLIGKRKNGMIKLSKHEIKMTMSGKKLNK